MGNIYSKQKNIWREIKGSNDIDLKHRNCEEQIQRTLKEEIKVVKEYVVSFYRLDSNLGPLGRGNIS